MPCSPSPSCSPDPLSLSRPLGPSLGLRKPWEPSEALDSFWSSVRLRGLALLAPPYPLTASHPPLPLNLPGTLQPSWGLRKPWDPLEAFSSLGSSVRLRSLAPLTPHPLAPSHSPHPLSLPGPHQPSWGLRKPCKPLEAFGSLGSSVRLRGLVPLASLYSLAPSCFLSLPLTP